MKELQPVNQYVLLDIDENEEEQTTSSGIIIPETAKEKQNIAEVAGMSAIDNAEVAVGDTVLYKEYAGTETEFEGKKYLLLPYGDILAIVMETDSI